MRASFDTTLIGSSRQTILLWLTLSGCGQPPPDQDWPYYGGDPASTKSSPLTQVNLANVDQLEIAWRWPSPDNAIRAANPRLAAPFLHEATPVAVDGVLYTSTSYSLAAAVDGATGATLWTFDPGTWKRNAHRPVDAPADDGVPPVWGFVHRGLAYWRDGSIARVFLGTGDARLFSLDATTGRPDSAFGIDGAVDLTVGLSRPVSNPERGKLVYGSSSPPIVCGGVLVVGSNVSDGIIRFDGPPGDVRGYDPRTGAIRWRFNAIPADGELGADSWENGSNQRHSNANVWSLMSCDPELGYVYLPLTTPAHDYYGGTRRGDNLFAESLVALDARTGRRVWHFQITHHGLWDYDLPAAPVLADITVRGRTVRAVVQVTKQGFAFVFDRATGTPIWPIEERAVPTDGAAPGERPSPTQPFPTTPAPFDRQGVTADNLIDFTPELAVEAAAIIRKYRHGPLYTPPSERGTLVLPGRTGGANWSGAAFDAETGILYVPSQTKVDLYQLRRPPPSIASDFPFLRFGGQYAEGPRGLPLVKPPYGRITAIDLNRDGTHLWVQPVGQGPNDHPALRHLNLPELGSPRFRFPLLTAGGLLLLSEGRAAGREAAWWEYGSAESTDALEQSFLRAYDKRDGRLLASYQLPGPASALPMTYRHRGRQFLVVAVGGMGIWDQELIAFALPAGTR